VRFKIGKKEKENKN